MATDIKNIRITRCEYHEPEIVAQKIYKLNSLGESIWGCIKECPDVHCEYNLNPKQEGLRYSIFGRTSVW